MTTLIGMAWLNAPMPATISVERMKSVAYATEDSASDERTARPVTRERRSWCAMLEGIGLPTRSRLREKAESLDIRSARQPRRFLQGQLPCKPTGLADGLGLGMSLGLGAGRAAS